MSTRTWPHYPTTEDAVALQLQLVQWLGGEAGVDNYGKLEGVLEGVAEGDWADEWYVAAGLLRGLAREKCFVDANKRMALALPLEFLKAHGHRLQVGDREGTRFVAEVMGRREISVEEIHGWLVAQGRAS